MSERIMSHSPAIFGPVTVNTDFTHDGETHMARGFWASADGTIDILMEDGTAYSGKQVFRGVNIFRCKQVTNLNSLTLEWFA